MAGIPFDGSRVHDSDSINGLGFLPTSVVITGSGVIAIEYAQIFRKLGAEVTMLVRGRCADGLARVGIDVDVARMLIQSMRDGEEPLERAVGESRWREPLERERETVHARR
jgi:NAD(P) transhydrogenase